MFYVYAWYDVDTNEIFYIGKGCRNRYSDIRKRNKKFLEYYNNHNCDSKIIAYFENEEDALKKEKELILEYKQKSSILTNLDEGGTGGVNFVWTQEMKDYKSKYNPMKNEETKQKWRQTFLKRLKEKGFTPREIENHNKMKKPVIINEIRYNGIKEASQILNVQESTITHWCQRGYDTNGNPCRYENEEQKEYSNIIKKFGARVTNTKAVIIDDINHYDTVKEAAQAIGGNSSNLIRAIKANRTYLGHTCKYANQQPSQENNQQSCILEGSTTNE